jgi:FkbM family methyltransferase
MSRTIDGVQLTGDVAEHWTYLRQMANGREGHVRRLFAESVHPGMTVLDVGAFLGWFAIAAAQRAGPAGAVIAFEPHPVTFPILRRNVLDNGLEGVVDCRPIALGSSTHVASFDLSDLPDTATLYPGDGEGSAEVHVSPGDVALDGRPVNVVKLDVEGGELEALRGFEGALADAGSDLKLFVECNPEALHRAGARPEDLFAHLRARAFEVRAIDEDTGDLVPVDQSPPLEPYVNLLCERSPAG